MPVIDAAVLTAILTAFVAFGVVVAWGEYQTRNIRPIIRPSVVNIDSNRSPTQRTVLKVHKAA